MFELLIIGLTGSIGAGKSVVSAELQKFGAKIIDADILSRKVVEPNTIGIKLILENFGERVFEDPGQFEILNRKALGEIVFNHPEKLKLLNTLLHPLIIEETQAQLKRYAQQGERAAVIDAALLIEAGMQTLADEVWLIIADDSIRRERIMRRDKLTAEQANLRMKSQIPQQDKRAFACRIIYNNRGVEVLQDFVRRNYRDALARKEC